MQKAPNAGGLHDTAGNVWEWVQDCYREDTYGTRGPAPVTAPLEEDRGCSLRVLRGGSFSVEPGVLRSANRFWVEPEYRYVDIGFRCVRGSGR
jgi:formylglycine-generating enzyme required for sulfatase activity